MMILQNVLVTFVVLTFLLTIDGLFLIPTASRGSILQIQIIVYDKLYLKRTIFKPAKTPE